MFTHNLAALMVVLILPDQVHAVIGGREAVAHSRPYMVLLERNMESGEKRSCGGFLLSEDFVMTTAHCQANNYKVLLGVHDKNKQNNEVQTLTVEQAFPHEDYNSATYRNDLMILKLSSKAKLNQNVEPIDLADCDDGSLPTSCSVSGWGQIDWKDPYMTDKLQETNVTLIDDESCKNNNFYCSRDAEGVGRGDGGAPLVCGGGKAYGVVSFLHKPDLHTPAVSLYTKIPDYKDWINSIIKEAAVGMISARENVLNPTSQRLKAPPKTPYFLVSQC